VFETFETSRMRIKRSSMFRHDAGFTEQQFHTPEEDLPADRQLQGRNPGAGAIDVKRNTKAWESCIAKCMARPLYVGRYVDRYRLDTSGKVVEVWEQYEASKVRLSSGSERLVDP
jgi:hypothetical protein